MDALEYKPLYLQECQEKDLINCELGDNGHSVWCASPDELARALSKQGLPRSLANNTTYSLAGDTGVSSSEIKSEIIGI